MYVQIFMTLYEGNDRHIRDFKNNIKKELFLLVIKKDACTFVFSFVLEYFFQQFWTTFIIWVTLNFPNHL